MMSFTDVTYKASVECELARDSDETRQFLQLSHAVFRARNRR